MAVSRGALLDTHERGHMDVIERLWPRLADSQRKLLESMAVELAGAPKPRDDERLTVSQIVEQYPTTTETAVRWAMKHRLLPWNTPTGLSKPRIVKRSDVEAWLDGD